MLWRWTRSKLHEEWLDLSDQLRSLKALELKLRNRIAAPLLSEKVEGTVSSTNTKYKITATARVNRTIDRELLEAIWEDLSLDEQECIDYKPSLVLSNYKPYEETGGKLMEAVTVKPGQASLKIERLP